MPDTNSPGPSKYFVSLLIVVLGAAVIVFTYRLKGPSSFLFAWCLHFMLMMALMNLVQTFKPKLNSTYFDLQPFEQGGKIYKLFGVDIFRKLLVIVGWEKLIRAGNPISKKIEHVRNLELATRQSEYAHLVIFFIVLAVACWTGLKDGIKGTAWLLGLNVIFHFYPIILQRYNRPKYQRLLAIIAKKESTL